jgi:hypothetical protein
MENPLANYPIVKKYYVPLTDNGVTWNGKYIILSEALYKKLIKSAK